MCNEIALLPVLAGSVSKVVELEILKFDTLAWFREICTTCLIFLEEQRWESIFQLNLLLRVFFPPFAQSKMQNNVYPFEVGAVHPIFVVGNLHKICQFIHVMHRKRNPFVAYCYAFSDYIC